MTYHIKKKMLGFEMRQREVNLNKKKVKWEVSPK